LKSYWFQGTRSRARRLGLIRESTQDDHKENLAEIVLLIGTLKMGEQAGSRMKANWVLVTHTSHPSNIGG
jgi:uncharacterized iron-regulated protein